MLTPDGLPGPHNLLLDLCLQGSPQHPTQLSSPCLKATRTPGRATRSLPTSLSSASHRFTTAWRRPLWPPQPPPGPWRPDPTLGAPQTPTTPSSETASPPHPGPAGWPTTLRPLLGAGRDVGSVAKPRQGAGYRVSQVKDGEEGKGTGSQHNTTQGRRPGRERAPGCAGVPREPYPCAPSLGHCLCSLGAAGCVETCWPSPLGPLGLETPQAMARQLPIPVTR